MKFTTYSEDKVFENPTVGSHNSTLIQVVDLGTQEEIWEGETKRANKVLLVFELDEKMKDGRPFVAHRKFNTTMHEKSSLRAFLEAWRGAKFTTEQINTFDLNKLLGQGAILSLVMSKNGKYVDIASASKLMAGMTKIQPVNHQIYFDLDEFDQGQFDLLWPWVQRKILTSPQYLALSSKDNTPEPDSPAGLGLTDDDIAF